MIGQPSAMTRRGVVRGSAVAVTGLVSAKTVAFAADRPPLRVFDGRESLSRQFAGTGAGPRVDIVDEEGNGWRTFRSIGDVGRIIGLTRWGEFLMARSFLEERSLRVAATSVRSNGLVYWTMS